MRIVRRQLFVVILLMPFLVAPLSASEGGASDFSFRPAILPKTMVAIDGAMFPDSTWWLMEADLYDDMLLETRRLLPLEHSEKSVQKLTLAEWPEAYEIVISEHSGLSRKLSYPVMAVEFLNGRNEDTWRHFGALVFCDDRAFWIDASVHGDSGIGDDHDSPTPDDMLGGFMRTLVASLEFIPPEEMPAIKGAKVMFFEGALEEWESNEVMNALIRIKRELNPGSEEGRSVGDQAYRYDGIRMLSLHGLAMHSFAFGTDSPEKFTAERHLGADRRGVVYESNILDGGSYEPVRRYETAEPDDIPFWWGEYRSGGTTLRIGNFREGPYSMYFVFDFVVDGETVAEGTAVVDDREASYAGLRFMLDDKNDAVTVATDPGQPFPKGMEELGRYAGVYRREP